MHKCIEKSLTKVQLFFSRLNESFAGVFLLHASTHDAVTRRERERDVRKMTKRNA